MSMLILIFLGLIIFFAIFFTVRALVGWLFKIP